MQVSDIFIRRPVFAVVVSLLLMVGGLAALLQMPVREYPAVDPPIVSVNTVYKGASNEVIESRVTELVEGSVAGIEGIRQITSQSRNERSSVTIEFVVGRDPDAAAADVRDRVARIMARLPDGVDPPVISKVDANAQAIMWIGVTSTSLDSLELTDFMKRLDVSRLAHSHRLHESPLRGPPIDPAGRIHPPHRRPSAKRHADLDRPPRA